jgi:Xaa-Pro aminopeptidase
VIVKLARNARRATPAQPSIGETHAERLAQVRSELERRRLDGYLIFNRQDQFWLTGFTGEDGAVLVTARAVVLLTDGRFGLTAQLEAPWARAVLRKRRTPDVTAGVIRRQHLSRVGFDPAHLDVGTYAALQRALRPVRLLSASGVISAMRRCKTAGEVAAIRRAIAVAQEAFEAVRGELRVGLSEAEIAARLVYEMQTRGAEGPAFPPIVAAGATAALPHYTPGSRRLKRDEVLLLDWGARVDWYVSDLTRVVCLGTMPAQLKKAYAAVREAHDRAIAAVRPGVRAAAVDRVARDVIRRARFGERFNHSLGHGIGLNVHEAPRLSQVSKDVLELGMIITIEPGVYLPGVGGVRLEDDVIVTPGGCEVLSSLPL